MVQLSPLDLFFPEHSLYFPEGWKRQLVTIVRPISASVELDGVPLLPSEFVPVGPGHEIARIAVDPGLHSIRGSEPIATIAVGYAPGDAYAYGGSWGTAVPDYPPPE
jgi:hypothetical protein